MEDGQYTEAFGEEEGEGPDAQLIHSSSSHRARRDRCSICSLAEADIPRTLPEPETPGTVIIFDWDDTLFPTWFISEVVIPGLPEESRGKPLPVDSVYYETMANHAKIVQTLLQSACAIGRVGLVTLSLRPWVLTCANRFLPGLDFETTRHEFKIPVVYARECVTKSMRVNADVEEGVNILTIAKQAAMQKALKRLYGKGQTWRNIISVGDSIVERDALKELLWSQDTESDPLCKTVKLMEEPTAEQLGAQMMLLSGLLGAMARHEEDFDIVIDDSEETRRKMTSFFCP